MKTIILLSTYNGETYLRQQLDSICAQDYKGELELYVRDDGSCDGTKEIIDEYKKKLTIIFDKDCSNYGAAMSFWRLLCTSPVADYYFFSDQDDVWDSDKISSAIIKMSVEEKNDKIPVLLCCQSRTIDANGKIIKSDEGEFPQIDIITQMISGEVPGCAMAFNLAALDVLKNTRIDTVVMHDLMLMLYILVEGKVIYDTNAHFSRRVHENNVVANLGKSKYRRYKDALKRWIKNKNMISNVASELIQNEHCLDKETVYFLKLLSQTKDSIKARFKVVRFVNNTYHNNASAKRSFIIRTLLGVI